MYEFTKCAENVLEHSKRIAVDLRSGYVGTEHILYGLAKVEKGIAAKILLSQNVTSDTILSKITEFTMQSVKNKELKLTPRAQKVVENSICECKKMNNSYVGTEHLLLSIIKETDSIAVKILMDLNLDPTKIMLDLVKIVSDGMEIISTTNNVEDKELPNNLAMYAKNLTFLAKTGKIEPLFERDEEIEQIEHILQRKTKNNVLIIGEAGVGKTALVEGLALKIAQKQVCDKLQDAQILMLDLSSMVAGAKYRGDFEERLKNTLKEVKENSSYILFVDEIHNVVGAGSAEGAIDAAAILKPILARNEIKIIGTTTFDEYKKSIEKDSALVRRFQNIVLDEPDEEKCKKILHGVKEKYEKFHKVNITNEAIDSAIKLSMRYITMKSLPDKALDLLDEACICAKSKQVVQSEDVCKVLSKILKIPVTKLTQSESKKYSGLAKKIKEKIIGQDNAVDVVTKAVIRGRVGLKDPKRPIGCFMFLGPTGVGKTELVKVLASEIFDTEKNLIRLDMSEYAEQHSIAKLIGAPPGYVGYEEGGKLTEEVKKKPYSVVLFDEIEKAHPDIYNILLQIMDDGRLTDSMSRTIDFKNTICIMTSNVGAKSIIKQHTVGFGKKENILEDSSSVVTDIQKELKKVFSPEFLNRLDEIVTFKKLSFEDLKKIAVLQMEQEKKRIELHGLKLTYSKEVVDKICEKSINNEYGARPIKREIQTYVTDRLAEYLINNNKKQNQEVKIEVRNGKIELNLLVK